MNLQAPSPKHSCNSGFLRLAPVEFRNVRQGQRNDGGICENVGYTISQEERVIINLAVCLHIPIPKTGYRSALENGDEQLSIQSPAFHASLPLDGSLTTAKPHNVVTPARICTGRRIDLAKSLQ